MTLTEYADRVILFHRRDRLRAQRALQERVLRHPKMDVVFNTVVESIQGEGAVTGVQVRNLISNKVERVGLSGFFVYVGLEPRLGVRAGRPEDGQLRPHSQSTCGWRPRCPASTQSETSDSTQRRS